MAEISYRLHRYPPVVIQHAVWLYLRFTLSYRDVEELLAKKFNNSAKMRAHRKETFVCCKIGADDNRPLPSGHALTGPFFGN